MVNAMRSNLGSQNLYDMIKISLEIECFEYYYLLPLLKETSKSWGYASITNLFLLRMMAQQTLRNIYQLNEWSSKLPTDCEISSPSCTVQQEKIDQELDIYSESGYSFCVDEQDVIRLFSSLNHSWFWNKNFFKEDLKIYQKDIKKSSDISFFSWILHFDRTELDSLGIEIRYTNNLSNLVHQLPREYILYVLLRFVLVHKEWKAEKWYLNMAYTAYCDNKDISSKFLKMVRFERQILFLSTRVIKFQSLF